MKQHKSVKAPCVVRLDRLQFVVPRPRKGPLPEIRGYRVLKDTRVRSQTNITTYARCRKLEHSVTGAKLNVQYQKQKAWLAGWKVTVIAAKGRGLTLEELGPIVARCKGHRLLMAEVAFDFSPESGVNLSFVRRRGVFGKSRRRFDRGGPGQLRFGSRRSGKLVRCYDKRPEIDAFRVEVELHSRLLKDFQADTVDALHNVSVCLVPRHITFVRLDWKRLRRHLVMKLGSKRGKHLFHAARERAPSFLKVCRFLRRQGVCNVYRFQVPMKRTRVLRQALSTWAAEMSPTTTRRMEEE